MMGGSRWEGELLAEAGVQRASGQALCSGSCSPARRTATAESEDARRCWSVWGELSEREQPLSRLGEGTPCGGLGDSCELHAL